MQIRRVLLALFFLVTFTTLTAQQPMRVAMVVPNEGTEGDFWHDFPEIAQVAARRLGFELSVHVAARWPGTRAALVESIVNANPKPDYLVTTVHMGMGTQEIELSEKAHVPVFIVNAGLLAEDIKKTGGPRQHFKYWIGQMLPDEKAAGRDEAETLIRTAKARFGNAPVAILALGGRETDWPAIERNNGLKQAVAEQKDVQLAQLVTANYLKSEAKAKFPLMLKRYTKATAVWGANDPMVLGAMETLEGTGRSAGKDLLFGGIDWDPKALNAIKEGRMVVSMGGHLFDGAWAMVLLYDYNKGIDFAKERVDWRSRMFPITAETVDTAIKFFKEKRWSEVDFRAFSKSYHPELTKYNFSVAALFKQQPAKAQK